MTQQPDINLLELSSKSSQDICAAEISADNFQQFEDYWRKMQKLANESLRALRLVEETRRKGWGLGDVVTNLDNGIEYKVCDYHPGSFFKGYRRKKNGTWSTSPEYIYRAEKKEGGL